MPAIPLVLILFLLMSGCAKRKANLSPDDEKLVPAYAGILLLSEEFKSSPSRPDSANTQRQIDSILSSNGLTRETFTNKLQVLAQSPSVYQQFTEKVRKELEHRKLNQPSSSPPL